MATKENDSLLICGGSIFYLLTQCKRKKTTEGLLMRGLIRAVNGPTYNVAAEDIKTITSHFKNCHQNSIPEFRVSSLCNFWNYDDNTLLDRLRTEVCEPYIQEDIRLVSSLLELAKRDQSLQKEKLEGLLGFKLGEARGNIILEKVLLAFLKYAFRINPDNTKGQDTIKLLNAGILSAIDYAGIKVSRYIPVEEKSKGKLAKTAADGTDYFSMLAVQKEDNPSWEFLTNRLRKHDSYFVETSVFKKALQTLRKKRKLLIIGDPGSGKSTTSEMIAKEYIKDGYDVFFSDEIADTRDIINRIRINRAKKELIILDDCFGQIYYKLSESGQTNNLSNLIDMISNSTSKVLLMNSRVNIFNSATADENSLSEKLRELGTEQLVFSISDLTKTEKADILISQLKNSPAVRASHCQALIMNANYEKILSHRNYTPRIMQHIASDVFIKGVDAEGFVDKIVETLNNPLKIWDDEYKKRLLPRDRILLTTLYSITEGSCPYNELKKAYDNRLQIEPGIDISIDQWSEAEKVLSGSMIEVFIANGVKYVRVMNPSVNDYLKSNVMYEGSPQKKAAQKAITWYCQIYRLFDNDYYEYIKRCLIDKSVLKLIGLFPINTTISIVGSIATHLVLEPEYHEVISTFFKNGPRRWRDRYFNFNGRWISEPSIGASHAPTNFLTMLVNQPETYKYYIQGRYSSSEILDFLAESDSLADFWGSIARIRDYNPLALDFDTEEGKFELREAINKSIENHSDYYDVQTEINDILAEDNNEIVLFSPGYKDVVGKKLREYRIDEILCHTVEDYACDDEWLNEFFSAIIKEYDFDFSYDIDDYFDEYENPTEDDDKDSASSVKQISVIDEKRYIEREFLKLNHRKQEEEQHQG